MNFLCVHNCSHFVTSAPQAMNYTQEIGIGLLISGLAAILSFAFNRIYLSLITESLYGKILGEWKSFAFSSSTEFDRNKLLGIISISKTGPYVFRLVYEEKIAPHKWEGEIYMNREMEKIGRICWRYVLLHGESAPETTISGFKDFVIERNAKYGIMLRIIGERDKGYGDELLVRNLV